MRVRAVKGGCAAFILFFSLLLSAIGMKKSLQLMKVKCGL